jgi:hypothetical protein
MRNICNILAEKSEGNLEMKAGRIILKKRDGRIWIGLRWLRIASSGKILRTRYI